MYHGLVLLIKGFFSRNAARTESRQSSASLMLLLGTSVKPLGPRLGEVTQKISNIEPLYALNAAGRGTNCIRGMVIRRLLGLVPRPNLHIEDAWHMCTPYAVDNAGTRLCHTYATPAYQPRMRWLISH